MEVRILPIVLLRTIVNKQNIQILREGINRTDKTTEGQDNFRFAFPDNGTHVPKHEPRAREEINPVSPKYNSSDTVLDAETLEIIINRLDANS